MSRNKYQYVDDSLCNKTDCPNWAWKKGENHICVASKNSVCPLSKSAPKDK